MMSFLLLSAFFLGLDAIPYYNATTCGIETKYTSFKMRDEATNRTGAAVLLAPWAVTIHIGYSHSLNVICGGTLITYKHVITAAHCFRKELEAKKKDEGYSNRYCEPTQRFSDSEILASTKVRIGAVCNKIDKMSGCEHPEALGDLVSIKSFKFGNFFSTNCENGNDIMLIELDRRADDIEAANHVCLPFAGKDFPKIPDVVNVTSFGWGSDPGQAYDHEPYPMIQVLDVETESLEDCTENWGSPVPDDSYCTREEEEKNMCAGDSGGGITYSHPSGSAAQQYLVGVVSYGTDCSKLLLGAVPRSQINTDVRKHQDLILDFIQGKNK